jgi:hypothetical protein
VLNPKTTLAIILGVSKCPRAPKLQPLPQCANSAEDFEHYLRSSLGLPRKNIISLFDSELSASDQLDQLEDWLALSMVASASEAASDLLVYYTGHAGFSRNDQSYFLAIRKTREGSEGATSIRYVDFASSIKRHAEVLRKYLILDCCFAAAAVVRSQADISQVVIQRLEDELPPSGTAVLCSSAAKLVSIAPIGERYTMFSGALLQCLREGLLRGPKALTLEDVGKAVREIIQTKYPNDSVRPELHVPEQIRGNPARVPLFPNVLWTGEGRDEPADRNLIVSQRAPEYWLATLLRHPLASLAAGILSGVTSSFAAMWFEYPLGIKDILQPVIGTDELAPILPAVFFSVPVLLVVMKDLRIGLWAKAIVLSLTYLSWQVAWLIVLNGFHFFISEPPWVFYLNWGFLIGAMIAGYVGSFLLTSTLTILLTRTHFARRFALHQAALSSIPFGVLGAISALPVVFLRQEFSVGALIGIFVPWQSIYLVVATPVIVGRVISLTAKRYVYLLLPSILLVGCLQSDRVESMLNRLSVPQAPVKLEDVVATKDSPGADETKVTIKYAIENNLARGLNCHLQVESSKAVFKETYRNLSATIAMGRTEASSQFSMPNDSLDDSEAWLTCYSPLGVTLSTNRTRITFQ